MSDDTPVIGVLKKHKNRFLEIIEEAGLDPQQFHTMQTDLESVQGFMLVYTGSPFRFGMAPAEDTLNYFRYVYTLLAPKFSLSDLHPKHGYAEISVVHSEFAKWLENHLKPYLEDLSTPDHWAQVEAQKSFDSLDPGSEHDGQPFTEAEKTELRVAIGKFKAHIVEKFDPVEEQLKTINQRLVYLTESVDRLNRFDWKSVALNIVLSIISMLNAGHAEVGSLIEFFKGLFSKALLPE